jgi:hypothetical protein
VAGGPVTRAAGSIVSEWLSPTPRRTRGAV